MREIKGFTVRKRKDCNRFELLVHPVRKLGIPIFYGGLYKTRDEAEGAGFRALGKNVRVEDLEASSVS
jgi:hypothetical protein